MALFFDLFITVNEGPTWFPPQTQSCLFKVPFTPGAVLFTLCVFTAFRSTVLCRDFCSIPPPPSLNFIRPVGFYCDYALALRFYPESATACSMNEAIE